MQACQLSKELSNVHSYRLSNVSYQIDDQAITQIVYAAKAESLLKQGQRYSTNRLNKERKRLTKVIHANSVEYFSKQLVSFMVDTNLVDNRFAVITVIDTH